MGCALLPRTKFLDEICSILKNVYTILLFLPYYIKKNIHNDYCILMDLKIRWPILPSYVEILKINK